MRENRDKIHLEQIVEAIATIDQHTKGYTLDRFADDKKTFDATLMQFVNIGEMVNNLSKDFREKHRGLPWHQPVGMRNEIAHGYFEIEKEVVWQTVKKDLPKLKKEVEGILKNL